jgi:hypothetical protein
VEVLVVSRKVQFVWNDGACNTLMVQCDGCVDAMDGVDKVSKDEHALVRH